MSDIAISSRSCTERHGDFFESVVFHSSYEVSCFLLVVCLFFGWAAWFVLAVCLCWLLLFGWMGDTLGIVSLYSHAWEWTISTNGLMTVKASSAHGTRKKKKGESPSIIRVRRPSMVLPLSFLLLVFLHMTLTNPVQPRALSEEGLGRMRRALFSRHSGKIQNFGVRSS